MKLSATFFVSALLASAHAREFVIGLDSLKLDSDKPLPLEKRQHRVLGSDAFKIDTDSLGFDKAKRSPKPHKCAGRKQHNTANNRHGDHHNSEPTEQLNKAVSSYTSKLVAYFKSLLPFSSFITGTAETVSIPDSSKDQHSLMAESINSPGLLQSSLTQHPEIYTFTGYIRDSHALTSRFNSREQFSVVFAPTDEALSKLSQKPWEFPTPIPADDINSPESEERNEHIIQNNVHNFVSSHVSFANAPLAVGNHVTTTNGVVVTLAERSEGQFSVLAIDKYGKTLVADVVNIETVENGQVFIIDSSLVKP